MSLDQDLMGVGMPDSQARRIGLNRIIAITAAGTTSVDATVLSAQNKVINLTATGADGIRMSTTTPLMTPIFVFNVSGATGKVYPPTGGAINGGSTDAGVSVATAKSIMLMRLTTTLVLSILTA